MSEESGTLPDAACSPSNALRLSQLQKGFAQLQQDWSRLQSCGALQKRNVKGHAIKETDTPNGLRTLTIPVSYSSSSVAEAAEGHERAVLPHRIFRNIEVAATPCITSATAYGHRPLISHLSNNPVENKLLAKLSRAQRFTPHVNDRKLPQDQDTAKPLQHEQQVTESSPSEHAAPTNQHFSSTRQGKVELKGPRSKKNNKACRKNPWVNPDGTVAEEARRTVAPIENTNDSSIDIFCEVENFEPGNTAVSSSKEGEVLASEVLPRPDSRAASSADTSLHDQGQSIQSKLIAPAEWQEVYTAENRHAISEAKQGETLQSSEMLPAVELSSGRLNSASTGEETKTTRDRRNRRTWDNRNDLTSTKLDEASYMTPQISTGHNHAPGRSAVPQSSASHSSAHSCESQNPIPAEDMFAMQQHATPVPGMHSAARYHGNIPNGIAPTQHMAPEQYWPASLHPWYEAQATPTGNAAHDLKGSSWYQGHAHQHEVFPSASSSTYYNTVARKPVGYNEQQLNWVDSGRMHSTTHPAGHWPISSQYPGSSYSTAQPAANQTYSRDFPNAAVPYPDYHNSSGCLPSVNSIAQTYSSPYNHAVTGAAQMEFSAPRYDSVQVSTTRHYESLQPSATNQVGEHSYTHMQRQTSMASLPAAPEQPQPITNNTKRESHPKPHVVLPSWWHYSETGSEIAHTEVDSSVSSAFNGQTRMTSTARSTSLQPDCGTRHQQPQTSSQPPWALHEDVDPPQLSAEKSATSLKRSISDGCPYICDRHSGTGKQYDRQTIKSSSGAYGRPSMEMPNNLPNGISHGPLSEFVDPLSNRRHGGKPTSRSRSPLDDGFSGLSLSQVLRKGALQKQQDSGEKSM